MHKHIAVILLNAKLFEALGKLLYLITHIGVSLQQGVVSALDVAL